MVLHCFLWVEAGGVGGLLRVMEHHGGGVFSNYHVAYDGNGNVTGLLELSSGTWHANYEYGLFGETIRLSGAYAKTNLFRFSTKFQDDESDLLYYGFRYYNPNTGRWPNRDPIEEEGGINLYGYVSNNPTRWIDFAGLITIGFYGFDSWIPGKNAGNQFMEAFNKQISDAEPLFESASVSAAFNHLLKKVDTNGDGKYDGSDTQQIIKIYGWSWGGASAVLLAKKIKDSDKFCIKDVKIVAVVDPVPRLSKPPVPNNVARFFNRYQTKGPGVPLRLHGVAYKVEQGVSDSQSDLNSTGKATTTKYLANGDPWPIEHISILWEVAADLLQELKWLCAFT